MQARPPGPPAKDPIPRWLKLSLWPFVGLSAIGFVLSAWVHYWALKGRRVAPADYFWMLHVGVFVVWFPAVMVTQKRTGDLRRKDFWKAALKGSPKWMHYLIYILGAYAVIAFILFTLFAGQPTPFGTFSSGDDWAGFSAGWMEFYCAAFVLLYAAAREGSTSARCVNGHALPANAVVCTQCGQPASPFR